MKEKSFYSERVSAAIILVCSKIYDGKTTFVSDQEIKLDASDRWVRRLVAVSVIYRLICD